MNSYLGALDIFAPRLRLVTVDLGDFGQILKACLGKLAILAPRLRLVTVDLGILDRS
jgi:hypothetical protein